MTDSPKPVKQWQLPTGVTRGLWDYTHSSAVATDYDTFFGDHSLFDLDQRIVRDLLDLKKGELIADLGCGTGRALVPLVRDGARGLAVDLSEHMLGEVRRKADFEDLPIECVLANLVKLECLAEDCVDHAICLFSTLGMIARSENRVAAVRHMRRILKPGGNLVIHVHNYWAHLFDPGGIADIGWNLIESCFGRQNERGDRYFPYRGVPKMYLHSFTERELRGLLQENGFSKTTFHPLNETQGASLGLPRLLRWIRASGWIVVCQ